MINIKKSTKIFFRTVYITSVIIVCLFIGIYGVFKAYEGIRLVGFGEYRKAVEKENDKIIVFDYEIKL